MERLLNLETQQVKKYGRALSPASDFYRWHCMARDFMFLQREEGNKTRCEMARSAAATFIDATMTGGRRNGTAIELYQRSIRLVLAY